MAVTVLDLLDYLVVFHHKQSKRTNKLNTRHFIGEDKEDEIYQAKKQTNKQKTNKTTTPLF